MKLIFGFLTFIGIIILVWFAGVILVGGLSLTVEALKKWLVGDNNKDQDNI